jgi:hypothetical protein
MVLSNGPVRPYESNKNVALITRPADAQIGHSRLFALGINVSEKLNALGTLV